LTLYNIQSQLSQRPTELSTAIVPSINHTPWHHYGCTQSFDPFTPSAPHLAPPSPPYPHNSTASTPAPVTAAAKATLKARTLKTKAPTHQPILSTQDHRRQMLAKEQVEGLRRPEVNGTIRSRTRAAAARLAMEEKEEVHNRRSISMMLQKNPLTVRR